MFRNNNAANKEKFKTSIILHKYTFNNKGRNRKIILTTQSKGLILLVFSKIIKFKPIINPNN